jgi:hypothetical protein
VTWSDLMLWIGPGSVFEPCSHFLIFQQPFSSYFPWTRFVLRHTT